MFGCDDRAWLLPSDPLAAKTFDRRITLWLTISAWQWRCLFAAGIGLSASVIWVILISWLDSYLWPTEVPDMIAAVPVLASATAILAYALLFVAERYVRWRLDAANHLTPNQAHQLVSSARSRLELPAQGRGFVWAMWLTCMSAAALFTYAVLSTSSLKTAWQTITFCLMLLLLAGLPSALKAARDRREVFAATLVNRIERTIGLRIATQKG